MKKAVLVLALALTGLLLVGCAILKNFHYDQVEKYAAHPSLAPYQGRLRVPGLQGEVVIYRDQYGVPHIFSDNEHDLFFAVGYVQAQDRLWEMILFRAIAEGRTAELFGNLGVPGMELSGFPLSTLGLDQHQRVLGLKYLGEIGEALLQETQPELFRKLQAYCDGVNALIASHPSWEDLPVEFRILQVKPEPWRVADMISFGRFIGTMLCSNLAIELPRYAALKKYGPEKAWQLYPLFQALGPIIVPTEMLKNKLAAPRDLPAGGKPSDQELGDQLPLSAQAATRLALAEAAFRSVLQINPSLGSNNWVVSGRLTESGAPMLANDPHLQHLQPSLFYLMHIQGAGYDSYGATFPGNPFIVLGHTRRLAWGATTSRADVQDLFIETADPKRPGQYRDRGEWRPFNVRREVIRVRSGQKMKEKVIEVRQSRHGPIINDAVKGLPEGTPAAALRWTGWDFSRDPRAFALAISSSTPEEFIRAFRKMPDRFEVLNILLALERLNRGQNLDDFIAAMDLVDLPNQNWVAADADGRIAYLPGGLVPVRGKGIGALPAPGESGEFDWTGFIPLLNLPHAIDPERGWMVTANNQVVDSRWYPYVFSTHYGEPWRAWRIEELIAELAPLDLEDMKRIQNDIQVRRAKWMVPLVLQAVETKNPTDRRVLAAVEELRHWDFEADLDSTATVIFFEFTKALFRLAVEAEVDKEDLAALRIEGYPEMLLDKWIAEGGSPFFDDRRSPQAVADMGELMVKALGEALAAVEKKWGRAPQAREWGKLHPIKWFHPLGVGRGKVLSVGPYPHLGAEQTVRNAKGAGFGRVPYKALTGPCLRHLMDLSEPDQALIVIDGSESGQWLSPHYDDLHPLFVNSQYLTAEMNPERVSASAKYRLVLTP
ncbi:MAG: hypothetical protein A2V67_05530 [Deltaproteobacteria bacterium RBG_13_61_14]|nr:MAG: hypothetical protein A2V67_05530 [Deltaproteobacteria bacterium RBG_13_61_14]